MKRTENRQNEQTAAIMARVSLEKQAREGYSLPAQVEIGTVIATKFGLVTNDKYVLVDAGYSGDDWDRPSIAKGLELLRTRKVVALIFTVSDRFARDVEGGLKIIREIRAAGGRIIFGDLGEYQDEANFRLMLTIKLAIAEFEKTQIRARSAIGTMRKVREGHPFGRGKYGFEIKDGIINPVIDRLAVVKRIYSWADMGESLEGIVNALKAFSIPPPKKNWNTRTVRNILQDLTYVTGEWYYNRRRAVAPQNRRKPLGERHRKNTTMQSRPKSEWLLFEGVKTAPVIDRDQYDRVQAKLAENVHTLGGKPSDAYLLTGLVWHASECNGRMYGHRDTRSKNTRYRCHAKDPDTRHRSCNTSVDAMPLEQSTWDAMMNTLGNEKTLVKLVETHLASEKSETAAEDVKRFQQRIMELRQIEFKARREELQSKEIQRAEFYRQQYGEAMAQRHALEAELVSIIGHNATGKVDGKRIARDIERVRKSPITEARAEKKELFKLWTQRIDYDDVRREAEITLRIPIMREMHQYSELAQSTFRPLLM
jgi:site-specific DNA recombinase